MEKLRATLHQRLEPLPGRSARPEVKVAEDPDIVRNSTLQIPVLRVERDRFLQVLPKAYYL